MGMIHSLSATLAIAAALVAAAPASAQRMSLADRIAVLEQQASNNQANVDLLRQVNLLKAEVQSLRSQIEELTHEQEQLKKTARAQYLDLDGRLNRIEGNAVGAPASTSVMGPPAAAPAEPAPATDPSAVTVPPVTAGETAPTIHGDAGTLALGAGERAAYDAAFGALRNGQYAESARLFQSFLGHYPNGVYAPNALYWLGESYYVTQNYQLAQRQFQALLDRYPTHDKAPGAMLKVGLCQLGLQQFDAAERTLAEVTTRYPGTDPARVASDRLSALQLGRLR